MEARMSDREIYDEAAFVGILWCCHVRGPDDIYAAPDYETALKWSDMINATNWRAENPSVRIKDPTCFEDCLVKAVPALWPYSAEEHAKDLPKSIEGFRVPADAA
jgi:hypothetical protein